MIFYLSSYKFGGEQDDIKFVDLREDEVIIKQLD